MYYTVEMPSGPPTRKFVGELRGGRGSSGSHKLEIRCWPDVFIVQVKTRLHTNEVQFNSEDWKRVSQHMNHRYATDLPEDDYPGTSTNVVPSLNEMLSTYDTVSAVPEGNQEPRSVAASPVAPSRPPARRRGGRVIEE